MCFLLKMHNHITIGIYIRVYTHIRYSENPKKLPSDTIHKKYCPEQNKKLPCLKP